ncbi:hypoxia inducible factor 1 subunit alpha, like 2 isoform X2 [Brienomyrus brachyistius]|uniref:hypoxia inducible factor 1 subunit alpha, like 2 isoform X2 n=1 Tax=Brienomyrus brachyistius TaxID=42636 RepID=UPI0020B3E9BC|nr:hypoxia inducible factor 1 subunit alpha, like 2 isoform X2 [Brienomyrus brachyistius]
MSEDHRRRTSSEWRRARSRAAAQSRREREGQLFRQLALELPLASGLATRLDKASVLRLSLTYLHLRALQENMDTCLSSVDPSLCGPPRESDGPIYSHPCGHDSAMESCVEKVLESALGGFLLLVSHSGQIIYTTDGIHTHTGINQMDLIGQNLFHFMHPCDLKEVRDILSSKSGTEDQKQCDLHLRIKCTLSSHGRPASLKSASWKVLHCTGIRKHAAGLGVLVLLCESLSEPPLNVRDVSPEGGAAFLSKHTPDMCFSYCQSRVSELTGYTESELIGQSVYQYYHALDCKNMLRTHLSLLSKGRVSTGLYRLLVKHGGFVWMETSATVVYNSHTGRPQGIICVNYILSDVEQPDVVLSLKQKEFRTSCSTGPVTAPSHVHLAAGSGLTVEKTVPPALHDVRDRVEVPQGYPFMETLLEWDTAETTQKATQDLSEEDLDTLAPYIPMDGEDFPLSPISDMVEDLTESRPEETLYILPYQEAESWGRPGCPSPRPAPPLHRPLTSYAPPQTQPAVISHYSPLQTHMLKGFPYWNGLRSAYSNDVISTSSPGKREVYTRKRHWTEGHLLSSRDQQSCRSSCIGGQPAASQWKKVRPNHSNYMPVKKCDPLWWSPGTMINGCYQIPLGFVPWAPKYRNAPSTPPAQAVSRTGNERRAADQPRAEPAAAVLPVLSRLECEVNAPLGPTSCLLHGAEILSVLDQATFRLCP